MTSLQDNQTNLRRRVDEASICWEGGGHETVRHRAGQGTALNELITTEKTSRGETLPRCGAGPTPALRLSWLKRRNMNLRKAHNNSLSRHWIAQARAVRIENEIARRGIKLNGRWPERYGPCPKCGGTDRFAGLELPRLQTGR
jgi:hypothetical protein